MCGRSSLTKQEKDIEARFKASFYSDELERYNPIPNYNVAPTHMMPAITQQDPTVIQLYKWGLIPSWAKESKIGASMINARLESLQEKPAFKKLLSSQRCILPLDGFYEWRRDGSNKIPFRIQTTDQEIFSVAGLWDQWRDINTSHMVHSFTIITLPSNEFMQQIHDRMPAILTPDDERNWLGDRTNDGEILKLITPYPSDKMKMYRVSDRVNNVRERSEDIIFPYDEQLTTSKPTQLTLF
jgi:putative SOS response-associated peptidase YedK